METRKPRDIGQIGRVPLTPFGDAQKDNAFFDAQHEWERSRPVTIPSEIAFAEMDIESLKESYFNAKAEKEHFEAVWGEAIADVYERAGGRSVFKDSDEEWNYVVHEEVMEDLAMEAKEEFEMAKAKLCMMAMRRAKLKRLEKSGDVEFGKIFTDEELFNKLKEY
jgi:hypothetical protein